MKTFLVLCGAAALVAGIAVTIFHSREQFAPTSASLSGSESGRGRDSNTGKSRNRAVENSIDSETIRKIQKFSLSESSESVNSRDLTNELSKVPLSLEIIDSVIREMGRDGVIKYLVGLRGEIHESEVSSVIYSRFVETEIELDYIESIDLISRIGVGAIQPENFSILLVRAINEGDNECLDLIAANLIPRDFWSSRVNATLLEGIMKKSLSYRETFGVLQEIDPSGEIAQTVAIEHFQKNSVWLDLDSDEGVFVVNYLKNLNFLNKEKFIEEFVARNRNPGGSNFER